MGISIGQLKNSARKTAYAALYHSGVLAHKTKVDWAKARYISCKDDEVKPLYTCSNTLYYIKTSGMEGYFRPILSHTSKEQCVRDAVVEYFTKVHPDQTLEKESLNKTLSDKGSFTKLLAIGNYSDPYSRARKFYLTKDTIVVGIETPVSLIRGTEEWKTFIWNIDHFLKYVMNAIARHQRNLCGGEWEFSNANRQMATEAVAKLLGLDYMIPHSEFAVLSYQGKELRGTLMEVAKGESTEEIPLERSQAVASPALQRELTCLNVLDAITFERDHRPGNYNILLDEAGKVSALSVFDNDAAMTFAPFGLSSHSGSGSSKIVTEGGILLNRPHLDKTLVERIFGLREQALKVALKPYLNSFQIASCWKRVKDLRKAIKETMKVEGFLLEPYQWSETTMAEELSGRYGRTYLEIFINNEEINKAFVEYNNAAAL